MRASFSPLFPTRASLFLRYARQRLPRQKRPNQARLWSQFLSRRETPCQPIDQILTQLMGETTLQAIELVHSTILVFLMSISAAVKAYVRFSQTCNYLSALSSRGGKG
jgi:hypothetical protein